MNNWGIDEFIDRHIDDMTELLKKLVRIPSVKDEADGDMPAFVCLCPIILNFYTASLKPSPITSLTLLMITKAFLSISLIRLI